MGNYRLPRLEHNPRLRSHSCCRQGQVGWTGHTPGAHADARIKPFFTEFINNYKRIDTEIDFNSLLFFSFSDSHHSVNLHRDTETVFLIQGYGECVFVAVNDDGSQKDLYRMKTGDAIILPPMYSHKSVPLGPRVTLSLGGLPKQHSH